MGRGRRLAAGASLLATAGGFAWLGVRHFDWIDWHMLAFAGSVAVAAVGLTRKNIVAQVLSRSMAWMVLLPTGVVAAVEAMRGHLDPGVAAFAATSGAALLLARPMLHSEEARAAFHPHKFRRTFLAACTVASTIALVVGMTAYEGLRSGHFVEGIGLGALAASIVASAVGVLRMRAWGIALAALSALVSLVSAMVVGGGAGVVLATTALPGVLFLLPVLLAKLGVGDVPAPPAAGMTYARIATGDAELPSRVRVATEDEASEDEAAAVPAARAAALDV